MRKSGGSMIQVPREIISGMMFALVPGFFLVSQGYRRSGTPRRPRRRNFLRLITIGFGAGIFFSGLMLLIRSKVANRTSASSDLD